MEFGEQVRLKLKERGYTPSMFSKEIGIKNSNFYRMLKGKSKFSRRIIKPIKEKLGVNVPKELIAKNPQLKRKIINKNSFTKIPYKLLASSYNSPIKHGIRSTLSGYTDKHSKILTLPSHQGLCVKEFIKSGVLPSNIDCIERSKEVLTEYKKLELKTNNFNNSLLTYLLYDNKNKYNVVFLDFCGSLTEDIGACIKIISELILSHGIIGVTLNIAHRQDNPTYNTNLIPKVKSILKDYKCISEQKYNDEGKRADMVFLLFKKRNKEKFNG